jgi:hypothetical protein
MKRVIIAAAACLALANTALAADSSCEAQATAKKLSGAAKTSFIQKCQKSAAGAGGKSCEAQAAEKKLHGAAQTSFVQKCQKDAAAASKQ